MSSGPVTSHKTSCSLRMIHPIYKDDALFVPTIMELFRGGRGCVGILIQIIVNTTEWKKDQEDFDICGP